MYLQSFVTDCVAFFTVLSIIVETKRCNFKFSCGNFGCSTTPAAFSQMQRAFGEVRCFAADSNATVSRGGRGEMRRRLHSGSPAADAHAHATTKN